MASLGIGLGLGFCSTLALVAGGMPWLPLADGEQPAIYADRAAGNLFFEGQQFTDEHEFDLETGFTFSRASVGYALNKYGYLEQQPTNVRRLEYNNDAVGGTARLNKVTCWNANPFDLTGVSGAGDAARVASIVDDTAALASAGLSAQCPSGRVFDLYNPGATTAYFYFSATSPQAIQHTASVYARVVTAAGNSELSITGVTATTFSGTAYSRVTNTGVITAGGVIIFTVPAGARQRVILPQLEEGAVATDPIETRGAATWAYSATTEATPKGDLIEGARTNLCLRSEEFDNASWQKSDATVVADAAIAPNGLRTADQLFDDADNAGHAIYGGVTPANGSQYVFSVFAKKINSRYISLRGSTGPAAARPWITFDFDTGDINANAGIASSGAEELGDGWWRIWASWISSIGTADNLVIAHSDIATAPATDSVLGNAYVGTGSNSVYIWGAQCELGTFPSSYIPTTSGSATRAADVAAYGPTEAVVGPELITDKTFATWTKTTGVYAHDSSLQMTSSGVDIGGYFPATTEVGKAYKFQFRVDKIAAGGLTVLAIDSGGTVAAQSATVSASGWAAVHFIAIGTTTRLWAYGNSSIRGCAIRNPSCREVENLVTNGDFPTNLDNWSDISAGTGASSFSSGAMRLQGSGVSDVGGRYQGITLEVGKAYRIRWSSTVASGQGRIGIGTTSALGEYNTLAGTNTGTGGSAVIVATQTTHYVKAFTPSGGGDFTIDNIIVSEVVPFRGYVQGGPFGGFFKVAKVSGFANTTQGYLEFNYNSNTQRLMYYREASGGNAAVYSANPGGIVIVDSSLGSIVNSAQNVKFAFRAKAGDHAFKCSVGTRKASAAILTTADRMGYGVSGSGEPADGVMGELAIWAHDVSDAEIDRLAA